ncbi:hypothetical protein SGLAM104S_06104 [Streptomyces glaucescens]
MRITGISTHVVGTPWRNLTYVQVHTDEGITGVGETRMWGHTDALLGYLKEAEVNHILGSDPFAVEDLVRRMKYGDFGRARRDRDVRYRRRRDGVLGHQGQGARRAGVAVARRQGPTRSRGTPTAGPRRAYFGGVRQGRARRRGARLPGPGDRPFRPGPVEPAGRALYAVARIGRARDAVDPAPS